MVDNIDVTPGTGKTIAADDISSVLHQRVKLSLGADGTANDATAGAGVDGTGVLRVTVATSIANPTSTYTRPSDTNAYIAGDLISNNVTAGSITVQAFTAARVSAGAGIIRRLRLTTNHTTGLANVQIRIRLWTAAPTYTNGDNGAYAVATGAAGFLGHFIGTFEQSADGASFVASPLVGAEVAFKLASGTDIYWDMETLTGFNPQSGKTFVLSAEILQD